MTMFAGLSTSTKEGRLHAEPTTDGKTTGHALARCDPTSHWGSWGFRSHSNAAPSHATVLDFQTKARSSCTLGSDVANEKSYRIIPKEDLEKAFKGAGWQQSPDSVT